MEALILKTDYEANASAFYSCVSNPVTYSIEGEDYVHVTVTNTAGWGSAVSSLSTDNWCASAGIPLPLRAFKKRYN